MCGRYTFKTTVELHDFLPDLDTSTVAWSPRYNIAPTQDVLITANHPGPHRLETFHWGLIPAWAKDRSIASHMINARAETVAEKPAFRQALERRRCLIWADGFYEWQKHDSDSRSPMYIRRRDGRPFAFAGLWDRWRDPLHHADVPSCTLITTTPNVLLAPIHDRMPVILPPSAYAAWLDPAPADPQSLAALLRPCAADALLAYPVSPRVNTPAHDDPGLIEPADPAARSSPARPARPRRRPPNDAPGPLFA